MYQGIEGVPNEQYTKLRIDGRREEVEGGYISRKEDDDGGE